MTEWAPSRLVLAPIRADFLTPRRCCRQTGPVLELDPIRLLTPNDDTSTFECGEESLDTWLKTYGLVSLQSGGAATYVVSHQQHVVGYYSLCPYSIQTTEAPERVTHGMGAYPVPAFLLARLGVDKSLKGLGIGGDLLLDALRRSLTASRELGGRAVVVDALHQNASTFYRQYGFREFDEEPLRLYMLMKDIRKTLATSS